MKCQYCGIKFLKTNKRINLQTPGYNCPNCGKVNKTTNGKYVFRTTIPKIQRKQ